MKILIVGGDGMLGHQLLRQWSQRHDVKATVRKSRSAYVGVEQLSTHQLFYDVDVRSGTALEDHAAAFRPNVIVNAVGVVKQRQEAKDYVTSLETNSVFPHRLSFLARSLGARVVHLSTDCVFSGRRGNYSESDFPDADDLYGRSKVLGELDHPHCLTLRTSIIGRELFHKEGLLEWFLRQQGTVNGFTHAIFSGFTTLEMSRIIERLLVDYPDASGIWHVSSEATSKYKLLLLVAKYFEKGTHIVADDSFKCDRSLDSSRFRAQFKYQPPTWEQMVAELSQDGIQR